MEGVGRGKYGKAKKKEGCMKGKGRVKGRKGYEGKV